MGVFDCGLFSLCFGCSWCSTVCENCISSPFAVCVIFAVGDPGGEDAAQGSPAEYVMSVSVIDQLLCYP